ncbi:hypothetical protein BaRGS_00026904 [Batillaria attramentaria]|uniref:Uncharacterized protein n=1 Tax=Batillaria attramentaria TaxID=370345 RepID=A0ABD0K478_9CAEN
MNVQHNLCKKACNISKGCKNKVLQTEGDEDEQPNDATGHVDSSGKSNSDDSCGVQWKRCKRQRQLFWSGKHGPQSSKTSMQAWHHTGVMRSAKRCSQFSLASLALRLHFPRLAHVLGSIKWHKEEGCWMLHTALRQCFPTPQHTPAFNYMHISVRLTAQQV